jgi:hypothetical protein
METYPPRIEKYEHEGQSSLLLRYCHSFLTMQCCTAPADVAQPVEQRFRKP